MRHRDLPIVELTRDFAQRPSGFALRSDVLDEVPREYVRPSSLRPFLSPQSRAPLLGE